MRMISLIFVNDLRRRLRSPLSVLLMMCIPLAMTLVIGMVFGRSGEVELPRIEVLLVDEDNGFVSRLFRQGFQQDRFAEMLSVSQVGLEEGMELMGDGKASALLIIPEGFSRKVLDREYVEIKVIKNPSEAFLPVIVEEIVASMAVLLDCSTSIFSTSIERLRGMADADGWPSVTEIKGLMDDSRVGITLASGFITDSLITMRSETVSEDGAQEKGGGFNIFAYVLSGSIILGLLFISNIMLRDIIREKHTGTLARTLAAPVRTGQIVAGKILAAYAVTMISCLLLLAVGRVAFGIGLGDPVALSAHLITTMLMCTGIMTLAFGLIRSERAADAMMSVLIIVMALLGGSMISLDQLSETFQRIGRFSPVFWANNGFRKIFVEGGGIADITTNLAILAAVGLSTMIPGSFFLDRRFRKGG